MRTLGYGATMSTLHYRRIASSVLIEQHLSPFVQRLLYSLYQRIGEMPRHLLAMLLVL